MSLLRSKRKIRIGLGRHQAAVVCYRSKPEPTLLAKQVIPIPGDTAPASMGALLLKSLAPAEWKGAEISVVLSHEWCSYALVPGGLTQSDDLSLASACIESAYGPLTADQRVIISQGRVDHSRIACAASGEMIDAICRMAIAAKATLIGIQPHMAAAYNARRKLIGTANAWLVIPEQHSCLIGSLEDGAWRSVRVRRLFDGSAEELERLIKQERLLSVTTSPQGTICCTPNPVISQAFDVPSWSDLPAKTFPGFDHGDLNTYHLALEGWM